MKSLNTYINEKLKLNTNGVIFEKLKLSDLKQYNYKPENRDELIKLIAKLIDERGNKGDFNDIDTSEITDMSAIFIHFSHFNGDISKWNVSKVTNMESLFQTCYFNGDLSEWDVSNVTNMGYMFSWASWFEGKGLENWDISKVTNMEGMFTFAKDLDYDNIESWKNKINKNVNIQDMFKSCQNVPDWYKNLLNK